MKLQRARYHCSNIAIQIFAVMAVGLLSAQPAHAEVALALFAGKSITDDGGLNLTQANTYLDFKDVSWNDCSFETPIFYGARIGYWFKESPNWGVSVDFNHLKNYLEHDKSVLVQGIRDGVVVSGREPIPIAFRTSICPMA